MTKDGLVETSVSGEKKQRVSKRLEEDDFSGRRTKDGQEDVDASMEDRFLEAQSDDVLDGKTELGTDAVSALSKKNRYRRLSRDQVYAAASVGNALRERHESRQKERTETRLKQKKKQQRLYAQSYSASDAFDDARDGVKKKQKKEQTMQVARKQGRLNFGDEQTASKGGMANVTAGIASGAVKSAVHRKISEAEEDNTGVQAIHEGERLAEYAHAKARSKSAKVQEKSRRNRLRETSLDASEEVAGRFRSVGSDAKKSAADAKRHAMQKQMVKKQYQRAAYQAAKGGDASVTAGKKITEIAVRQTQIIKSAIKQQIIRRKSLLVSVVALLMVFVTIVVSLGSCVASLQGASTPIISTTYASTDENIYAVEDAYSALEAALNTQINEMESTHSGYDEYDYQVDEISHNLYQLISYFTAKYGGFTYEQVKDEVEEIFRLQYHLSVESIQETVTETKTVKVGESLGQVVTSGYCNCVICCGIWSGGATASGAYPTANHTIAVDASNPFVPMGTKVIMNGVEYTVEDTGAFDQYGVQFDVYYDDHTAASAHGHQTWEAYIADSNGSQEVEVTTTQEVNRLNTTVTNKGLDAVLRSLMTEDEITRYNLYNLTYGNRDYLFDVDTLPNYSSDGYTYEIPPEALSDQKFTNMIKEAEKYLGYPYVWGGSSPSTSFDCSGFVSWVINNSGNGWNYGRMTADGLLGICTIVSPSEAQPGDLIFFQGTYNTPGASHVGIYVGNGMMIHCGNPIQYTSINTSYWQEHFYHFGRLP